MALVAALLVAAVVTGCTGARERTLPADRGRALLYVALGDSTVEGIGASGPATNYVSRLHRELRRVYPAALVSNLGVAGATSADVVREQLPHAIALRPDVVTLSVGPNDITARVGVDAYEANLETILGGLARDTRAVVVVNLLPDLAVTPRFRATEAEDRVARQTETFNDAVRRRARRHRAAVVDLYTASRAEVPGHPELLAADGYHPSDAGYARWATLMWAQVQPRIAAPHGSGR